ncbi:MAG: hypothetical protein QOG53_695 [Frankiales bacterium]|jgi:hypothetical protein|nr:hypothetical protein [Frankiales bacterium]
MLPETWHPGRVRGRLLLTLIVLVGTLAGDLTLVALRHDNGGSTPKASTSPQAKPAEPGLPTAGASPAVKPTGRGRGVSRAIPCYLLSSSQLQKILGSPMGLGQRAAGSSGSGLKGNARETCYWFATKADGPYVVISDITTGQLHDRGRSDWSARRYFDQVPPKTRTYLSAIGDAAYAYGPASIGVLVGDVYLDVMVVSHDGHPLKDAVAIARIAAKLKLTGP